MIDLDYIEGLNQSIDYVEEHLQEEIDFEKIAKIAGMSKSSYQHFFLAITNMTMNDYIRKRRLQSAVDELVNTKEKVLDIAIKYGYQSAASFTRALRSITDYTPTQIRQNGFKLHFPRLNFEIHLKEGEMKMNETAIVRMEEHRKEKVICFEVDCMDPEEKAWGLMSEWCRRNVSDRTARRFLGVAPMGHHPEEVQHQNASEHESHPYIAMMYLVGEEGIMDSFHGKKVEDAPEGLFLINDVALNQYDENGDMDMALSMMKASEAFMDFMKTTKDYEFDCGKGIFYEEHIFSEKCFQQGGFPDGFRMWVPILRK